jgi:V/A-type H+/Na+-transporting ATPase subunit C
MSPSGVGGYAFINARVRVMYSNLFTTEDMARLSEAADFPTLIPLLKQSVYGPYIEHVNEKDLTPRRAVWQIKNRLADAYISVIHAAPEHTHDLLTQFYRQHEVDNLKAVLRGIVTGAPWERIKFVLFPPSTITSLPAEEMVEAGTVSTAVELLRGTPYYETLSHAMKRYATEQNLFPLEVALDLNYWREIWKLVNKLPSQDRTPALKIVGGLVDANNLMWAIRYRVYHHLSEEELINYTLPFGYRVRDADIRAIAAGADIAQVVRRIYPALGDIEASLQEPGQGLPALELSLKRQVANQCQAAFVGDPFHIGIPLAYLLLSEDEIQDLTVLIEAKSSQLPIEAYRPYLLNGLASNR